MSGRMDELCSSSIIAVDPRNRVSPSNLGGLQETPPSPYLNRAPRNSRRQGGTYRLFECVRQTSGLGQVDGRTIGNARLVPSVDVVYTASSWNEHYLKPNPAI